MPLKPNFQIDQRFYHGTNKSTAQALRLGQVDVTKGGGELGRGFYLGNYAHVAIAWARHKFQKDCKVAYFDISNFAASGLNRIQFSRISAVERRLKIKQSNLTQSYLFGIDAIHTYIVGGNTPREAEQVKWESNQAEVYLNGGAVHRGCLRD